MINSEAPVAMYYQLKTLIIEEIKRGVWTPKSKIMSEIKMCETYKVSRATVRKAVGELVKDGYLKSIQGKGTFVIEKAIEQKLNHFYSFRMELQRRGINVSYKMVNFTIIEADDEVANHLQIEVGDKTIKVERLIIVKEKIFVKEISYMPYFLFPGLERVDIENNGLYNSLKKYNCFPSRAIESLKAANLSENEAKQMEMKNRDACIFITRDTYCDDIVIEYNTSIVRGDAFVYSVELSDR